MDSNELLVLHQEISKALAQVRAGGLEARHAIDDADGKVESTETVEDQHVKRCSCGSALLVSTHVKVLVVSTTVDEAVDQCRIPVKSKNDRLVHGENRIEFQVSEAMRVAVTSFESEKVDHVDESNAERGDVGDQYVHCGESLKSWHVSSGCNDYVGLYSLVSAGPSPDSDALAAVNLRLLHVEPLIGRVLACDDDVDELLGAEASISDVQQSVGIGREIDSCAGLVAHVVEQSWILVTKTVVVLAPYMRGEQNVQRRDGESPTEIA